jgi:periplasmic protein CpxP/Spy
MKKLRTILLAALVGCASLAMAQAGGTGQSDQQGPPPGGGHQGAGHRQMPSVDDQVNNLDQKLKLSDEQKTQVHSILQDQRDKMTALFQDQSTPQQERRAKMREVHEASNNKIREILNDDQKKKFDEYEKEQQQERQSRMRGGMNRE